MKKAKACLCVLTAVGCIGAISTIGVLTNLNKTSYTGADENDYVLVFDKDHQVKDAVIKTTLGNEIWVKANDGITFGNNGVEFTSALGYIQNLSAINSITSIKLEGVSGDFIVSYGFQEPKDLRTPEYLKSEVSSDVELTFSTNLPSHFRVQALDPSTYINKITVKYSCSESPADPNIETVQEGIENIPFHEGFGTNKASIFYDTENLCQTEHAVSKRSLKITNFTQNQNFQFVDLPAAVEAGLKLGDNDEYLIFDVKSNSSKMGQINPFMIGGSVTDTTYDIGWQDPTGFIARPGGNDGWYRYYWQVKSNKGAKIPFDKINNLSFITAQKPADDEYFIIDNIHFGVMPTSCWTLGKSSDMKSEEQFTISTGTKKISLYVKVTNLEADEHALWIGLGNYDQYVGLRSADCISAWGQGVTFVKMNNGWSKCTVDMKTFNYVDFTSNKTWNFDTPTKNEFKVVINGNFNKAEGFITSPFLEVE